jgi:hypothetical protein
MTFHFLSRENLSQVPPILLSGRFSIFIGRTFGFPPYGTRKLIIAMRKHPCPHQIPSPVMFPSQAAAGGFIPAPVGLRKLAARPPPEIFLDSISF